MTRLIWTLTIAFGLTSCDLIMPPSPQAKVCTQLVEQCPNMDADAQPGCESDLGEWLEKHPKQVDKLTTCVASSDSCAATSGCLVGAGINGIGGDVGEFIKGVGKALGL